jgi:phage terminase small subunit
MPVLKNPRHERFAQLLASGKTATDAHEKVGFKRSRFNASHFAARPGIGARIQQITTVAAMLGVMRDPTEPAERRDEMAKAAPPMFIRSLPPPRSNTAARTRTR